MAYALTLLARADRPGEPRPATAIDDTANDASKDLDVEALIGEHRHVHVVGGRLTYQCSSDVGNRVLRLELLDPDDAVVHGIDLLGDSEVLVADELVVLELTPLVAQPVVVNDEILVPIDPALFVPAGGWTLRIRDSAGIALAADDMTIALRLLVF